jgi:hypothetical protein
MKTIKEILKHAENICKDPGTPQDQKSINKMKIAMRVAIDEVQRWIPVEEELPEKYEKVLIKFRVAETNTQELLSDVIDVGFYLKEKLFDIEQMAGITVTHWRPIELK